MGWSFPCNPCQKSDTVKSRTRDGVYTSENGTTYDRKCAAHCVVGNTLWTVWHVTVTEPGKAPRRDDYIGCDMLAFDKTCRSWGYKDLCESMHPYIYNCPLAYLAMAPEASAEWRAGVRAWHAARAAAREVAKTVKPGDTVNLLAGLRPATLVVTSVGRSILARAGSTLYRVPRTKIASVVHAATV